MTNAKRGRAASHKAVMLLHITVHEVLESGECAARPVSEDDLQQYGLSPKMVLSCTGFDLNNCLTKLLQALQPLRGHTPR
jgi:hypothetical protein